MPRSRLAATCIFAAVVVAVVPDGAQARGKLRCATSGQTLTANRFARVFEVDGHTRDTYVCVRKGRRVRKVASTAIDDLDVREPYGASEFRLAGQFLAYGTYHCGREHGSCDASVHVRNLRTWRHATFVRLPSGHPLVELVLNGDGKVAWSERIADRPEPPIQYHGAIVTADRSGRRVVDEHPDVDPTSLALTGDRLYWLRGGAAQTFSLGSP